ASYTIDPSEDLLLSFEGESALARKIQQKSRRASSGKRLRKMRTSDTRPQISEKLLNDLPIWVFWYAVFEFLHMEVLSDYDVVFGITIYTWVALYMTTKRRYHE
ncbi:uncharacterized protein TRUGW13939_10982, partial [Talaromyces rugulosus]